MMSRIRLKYLEYNIFRYFIIMSVNIFTEQLKISLPNAIQDFIKTQNGVFDIIISPAV